MLTRLGLTFHALAWLVLAASLGVVALQLPEALSSLPDNADMWDRRADLIAYAQVRVIVALAGGALAFAVLATIGWIITGRPPWRMRGERQS